MQRNLWSILKYFTYIFVQFSYFYNTFYWIFYKYTSMFCGNYNEKWRILTIFPIFTTLYKVSFVIQFIFLSFLCVYCMWRLCFFTHTYIYMYEDISLASRCFSFNDWLWTSEKPPFFQKFIDSQNFIQHISVRFHSYTYSVWEQQLLTTIGGFFQFSNHRKCYCVSLCHFTGCKTLFLNNYWLLRQKSFFYRNIVSANYKFDS